MHDCIYVRTKFIRTYFQFVMQDVGYYTDSLACTQSTDHTDFSADCIRRKQGICSPQSVSGIPFNLTSTTQNCSATKFNIQLTNVANVTVFSSDSHNYGPTNKKG